MSREEKSGAAASTLFDGDSKGEIHSISRAADNDAFERSLFTFQVTSRFMFSTQMARMYLPRKKKKD